MQAAQMAALTSRTADATSEWNYEACCGFAVDLAATRVYASLANTPLQANCGQWLGVELLLFMGISF